MITADDKMWRIASCIYTDFQTYFPIIEQFQVIEKERLFSHLAYIHLAIPQLVLHYYKK